MLHPLLDFKVNDTFKKRFYPHKLILQLADWTSKTVLTRKKERIGEKFASESCEATITYKDQRN